MGTIFRNNFTELALTRELFLCDLQSIEGCIGIIFSKICPQHPIGEKISNFNIKHLCDKLMIELINFTMTTFKSNFKIFNIESKEI